MRYCNTGPLVLLAVVVLTATLSPAQKISTQVSPGSKLAGLQTFAFVPINEEAKTNCGPQAAQDIRIAFQAIGLREDDANPQLLVECSSTLHSYLNNYTEYSSTYVSENKVWSNPYHVGTLELKILDPNTRQALWRGTATETSYGGSPPSPGPKAVDKLVKAFSNDVKKQAEKAQ